ncbi:MAG TPA: hypothetical protein VF941_16110, partial [Clostridia bacterium]
MNKRNLSLMLVVLMCLSLFPLSVAAAGNVTATYTGGVVTVTGAGFTNNSSYIIRVIDTLNSSIKAMGQTTADGSGNISASITSGVLGTTSDYAIYVNNLDGTLAGSDTSVDAKIITYTATMQAGTGGTITTGTSGSYSAGATITLAASAGSGYSFSGWTSSNGGTFADKTSLSTTFTMPANDVVITANFTSTGNTDKSTTTPGPTGGGVGGGAPTVTTPYNSNLTPSDSSKVITVDISKGADVKTETKADGTKAVSTTIDQKAIETALATTDIKQVVVNISDSAEHKNAVIGAESFAKLSDKKVDVVINTGDVQ